MINISVLPAGIGDCIWIKYGDGIPYHNIIIDSGNDHSDIKEENIIWKIVNKISGCNIQKPEDKQEKIDAIFLTHPDGDHINGMLKFFSLADKKEIELIKKIYLITGRGIKDALNKNGLPENNEEIIETNNYEDKFIISEESDKFTIKDSISLTSLLVNKNVYTVEYLEEGYVLAVSKEKKEYIEFINYTEYEEAVKNNIIDKNYAVLKIISPGKVNLQEFQRNWENEWIKQNSENVIEKQETNFGALKKDNKIFHSLSSYEKTQFGNDDSVMNKASIAFMFEYENSRLALLGDAVPSVCIRGLEKFYKEPVTFDYIKMSHHGSYRNISRNFLDSFISDKFILSTDGTRKQPSKQTFYLLYNYFKKKDKQIKIYGNYNWRSNRVDSKGYCMFSKEDLDLIGDTIEFVNISDLRQNGIFKKSDKGIIIRNEI